jgi:hypothetical protein
MKILLTFLSVFLSGCVYSLAGIDMSAEGRHKQWVIHMQKNVGLKNMYDCTYWICGYRKLDYIFLGDKKLPGGNFEAGYNYWLDSKNTRVCKYFFEYEPSSGLIVGFRFEEPERLACRFTGA